ncbi:MAG: FAD-binding domain-containing protein, partial [Bacteroidota bacterium]
MNPDVAVVWLKRDLRTLDHLPFKWAIESGMPVIAIYLFEPILLDAKMHLPRHWNFVQESLDDMSERLKVFKIPLLRLNQDFQSSFDLLSRWVNIKEVHSYQETGIGVTFDRDKEAITYFKSKGIQWHEYQCNGVERARQNRYQWAQNWYQFMSRPTDDPPYQNATPCNIEFDHQEFNFRYFQQDPYIDTRQKGGESKAWKYMKGFLDERGKKYAYQISKPTESRTSCSRISPYLAWGCMSVKQSYQASKVRQKDVGWKRSIQGFQSRLRWHCHFIQKFEMEERAEHELFNKGYQSIPLRDSDEDFERWKNGTTGIPLIDACMRCLKETGYVNFRMRAMLVSFHNHHLFL